MRRPPFARLFAPALLAALLWVGGAVPAAATVEHRTLNVLNDLAGNRVAEDGEILQAPTSAGIDRAIFARIVHPAAEASSSVGRFGNLGVEARQFGQGELVSQVIIQSDEFVNLGSRPLSAQLNFIVDGGLLVLNTAPGATLSLQLDINVRGAPACFFSCFQAGIDLVDRSAFGGNPDVSFFGADLGAIDNGNGSVDIPFSFQSVDLGLIPPGQRLEIEYFLNIRTNVPQFAEILRYEFSDPLDVTGDSMERPFVVFASPEAVPPLALLGLLPLARAVRARLR